MRAAQALLRCSSTTSTSGSSYGRRTGPLLCHSDCACRPWSPNAGRKNIVISDPGAPFVGTVGVSGLIVVATADGVLVIPRDRAQDVRHIVDALRAAERIELLEHEPKPVMMPAPTARQPATRKKPRVRATRRKPKTRA
jgi:hypothetical protein